MTAGVYLIRAENGLVKIGYSSQVKSRLALLQTASPLALAILHVIETADYKETERALHSLFAGQRRRGEWFELSEDDIIAAKEYAVTETTREAPAPSVPEPAAPATKPEPPARTLSPTAGQVAARFGRALETASTHIVACESQGDTATAERWRSIRERLLADALAEAARWEQIAAHAAASAERVD